MDECGRTEYRGENFNDQTRILILEDEFKI